MLLHKTPDLFADFSAKPLFLALGNFDGVHLGHQKILKQVLAEARQARGLASLMTFQTHPQSVLHPQSGGPKLLMENQHKLLEFYRLGMDLSFFWPFTIEFSAMEPEIFVEEVLVRRLRVRKVFLGHNARFGRARRGSGELMKELAARHGFEFAQIPSVFLEGQCVSSSNIRSWLEAGKLEQVQSALGRHFSILGKVVSGKQKGRELGFPTANLKMENLPCLPQGVYPVLIREAQITCRPLESGLEDFKAQESGPFYEGVLNYGIRPTLHGDQGELVVEVHMINIDQYFYEKTLEVFFFTKIRSENQFENADALKEQIRKDILQAREMLSGNHPHDPRKTLFTKSSS